MKAAVVYGFGKPMVVEEVTLDEKLGKNEVRVRLAATAVCHSDIHEWRGEVGGDVPYIGGHESSGYVEEVGEGVTSIKPGDPVVASVLGSCGECFSCIMGLPHICQVMAPFFPLLYRSRNKKGEKIRQAAKVGSFAEYTIVDQSQVVKIPGDIPMDSAALLGCGFITGFGAAVNRAQVKALQSIAVIGTGGVGLSAIQGAALSGAYPVIAVDLLDNKLKAALSFGATHTVNSKETDPIEAVKKLTGGKGVDYALITVGNVSAINQAFSMLGPRGTAVIVGMPPVTETVTLSPIEFIGSEKTLTGCAMGSTRLKTDVPRLAELYKAGHIKLDEMITSRYPLEEINQAIDAVEKGQALRNVIIF
jgi:S-(hydroxymethyl)glutathione dehydrogenase/alcohol dehydrogenase